MLLCKKVRLEVSEQDAATLEFMQGKCRGLYNWLVMRLRAGERWHFAEEKARLVECRVYDPALNDVYGKLLAEVYFRLDKAMQAFFRRAANGETPGFPRVRPRHAFFTLCYPAIYNDWGLHSFVQMLIYKCRLAGKELIEINERDTSKTCSSCGNKQDMPLWKRTYRCETCGLVLDRDENAALNIRQRSLARLGPHAQAS